MPARRETLDAVLRHYGMLDENGKLKAELVPDLMDTADRLAEYLRPSPPDES